MSGICAVCGVSMDSISGGEYGAVASAGADILCIPPVDNDEEKEEDDDDDDDGDDGCGGVSTMCCSNCAVCVSAL